jgi:hypothetical protein
LRILECGAKQTLLCSQIKCWRLLLNNDYSTADWSPRVPSIAAMLCACAGVFFTTAAAAVAAVATYS